MSRKPRILFLVHGHPHLHPGGTEILARDLFQAVKAQGAEALFVAAVNAGERERKNGTEFQTIGGAADEVLLWSEGFDAFNLMRRDGLAIGPDLRELLTAFRPDVVHLHHLLGIGVETLFLLRRLLPQAKLIMTLHDYVPICANDGLMVKRGSDELCGRASADACHGCFPEIHQSKFVLRRGHLLRHLELIDAFVAPSRFARDRFAAFGIPPARIEHIPNARPPAQPVEAAPRGVRNRFGLFGNLAPHKGVQVAIEAALQLAREGVEFELQLHGPLRHQTAAFRDEVMQAVAGGEGRISWAGGYEPEELAARMASIDWVLAPSTWWENAPLVVLEAFAHGRPPIVSGIGGMAEQVRHGIDGLHVRPNDPIALARVMREAATGVGVWDRLCAGRTKLPAMCEIAERHLALYGAIGHAGRAAA